jgi:ketosteroid isomerase-like protein
VSLILYFLLTIGVAKGQTLDGDFETIKSLLDEQQGAWNDGDIDAFMQAYWKSEELQFGGASGITRGWQQTLDNYKVRYPSREAMGQLHFEIKDLTRHSADVISLTGSWQLTRENDQPGGNFLLIWRKINGEWKIVVDHTSARQ